MKNIYTMAAGFLLCAGLASCEMKEELFGKGEVPSETGKVELGVAVNDKTNVVITKAEAEADGDIQGSDVNPAEYPVIFTHQEADYTKEYIYEDIEGTQVTLPIGKYLVESHTPGELEKKMTYPYYGGSEELEVTKDVVSDAKVICTMQNSRILLTYSAEFSSKFTDWTITIDDGSDKTLVFTKENGLNPDAVYWYFGEECAEIAINITATTAAGDEVRESRTITKPAGASDSNWVGGDALTITMLPGEDDPENPSGVIGSGINIKVEAFFTTIKNEEVTVPIDGEETTEPEEPENPDEGNDNDGDESGDTSSPVLSGTYLNGTVNFDMADGVDNFPVVEILMDVPNKIQSIVVTAESDYDTLNGILANMGFDSGVDLASDQTYIKYPILNTAFGGERPNSGDSSYKFTITKGSMISQALANNPGTHKFSFVLTDQLGKSEDGTLTFSITDSSK